jgi:hypothetical protein
MHPGHDPSLNFPHPSQHSPQAVIRSNSISSMTKTPVIQDFRK